MFKGHQIVKLINNNWVFDFTEFIGYSIKTDSNGNIKSYKEAFSAHFNGTDITFDKKCRVPLKVLKEASNQILKYQSNMVEDNEHW